MKLISCNQEMGNTERFLCPGAAQSPARYSKPQWFGIPFWEEGGCRVRGGILAGRGRVCSVLVLVYVLTGIVMTWVCPFCDKSS